MRYYYGMRLRGFSPGCQPMKGLIERLDGFGRYLDILVYDRPLAQEELDDYELDKVEWCGNEVEKPHFQKN